MQGLEQSSFEFQDMFGASGQIQSAKDVLEDVSAQIGKFHVVFRFITGKFSKVYKGTFIDRSTFVWVFAFPSSALCWTLMYAPD